MFQAPSQRWLSVSALGRVDWDIFIIARSWLDSSAQG